MITSGTNVSVSGWIAGRLPGGLYTELLEVTTDREEITVIGRIDAPELAAGASEIERGAAAEGRIAEFRERTREQRIQVAREAEQRFGRKVSWGAVCEDRKALFTTVSTPVMTRLRQPERKVLDTLVEGGVARSRSDAIVWCVRLVQRNADTWLSDLRDSLEQVKQVRSQGPDTETPEA